MFVTVYTFLIVYRLDSISRRITTHGISRKASSTHLLSGYSWLALSFQRDSEEDPFPISSFQKNNCKIQH